MRKKEDWMFKGAIVLALGKKAVITKIQDGEINGTSYVYYIFCRLANEKREGKYHPDDISDLVITATNL